MKSEGYEIFVSKTLRKHLLDFWLIAKEFNDESDSLQDSKSVKKFKKVADKTTKQMEKLFGLK